MFVASVDERGRPNCAPKMIVDIVKPNKVFYVDVKFSRTFANLDQNWETSVSFMDDKHFTGFRLNGYSQVIDSGKEYEIIKEKWGQKIAACETDRMIDRMKGIFSTRESEIMLPEDVAITKFIAEEAAIVKPDRVLKAMCKVRVHPVSRIAEMQSQITHLERIEKKYRKTEEKLIASKDLLERTIDGIRDPVMVIDTKYRVVLGNETVRETIRTMVQPSKEIFCYQILHRQNDPCKGIGEQCPLKQVVATGKPVALVHQHFNATGNEVFIELTASPVFDKSGQVVQIVESCHDITDHVKTEKALEAGKKTYERKSIEDDLTGLYNRRGFMTLVEQQMKLAKRSGKEGFLIFSDVDSLKKINDELGHQMGDKALVETAEILKKTFRESDIIARIGGDEFAVAAIDCPQSYLQLLKMRLQSKLAEYNQKANQPYVLGLSVGATPFTSQPSVPLEELLSHADQLMYDEKRLKKSPTSS